MPRELPARPNLEQLKKQAKSLLHAAQARDGDALRRFAALPAFSGESIHDIDAADLALPVREPDYPESITVVRSRLRGSWPGFRCLPAGCWTNGRGIPIGRRAREWD